MKLLTKDTDYAVRALLALAKDTKGYQSAREIADSNHMPYQFLRTIMQRLIKEGFIVSKQGVNGGLQLVKKPNAIRVSDVMRVFQGDIQLSECMFRGQLCENRKTCVLRHEILRIEKIVNDEFKGITIGSLLKKMGAAK